MSRCRWDLVRNGLNVELSVSDKIIRIFAETPVIRRSRWRTLHPNLKLQSPIMALRYREDKLKFELQHL